MQDERVGLPEKLENIGKPWTMSGFRLGFTMVDHGLTTVSRPGST